jgi:hypothetical protein
MYFALILYGSRVIPRKSNILCGSHCCVQHVQRFVQPSVLVQHCTTLSMLCSGCATVGAAFSALFSIYSALCSSQ